MNVELYSDEDILNGCIKNDRLYQELLYRKYAKKMYSICLGYTGERDMAQDVLQESFIKIFKSIRNFKSDGSLEGWIRRIVVNTALDQLRQKSRLQKYITEKEEIIKESEELSAIDNLKTQDILNQVAKLPDGARVVFNLYALEGYTHREIADILEITEGTSKSQFNRARKLLIDMLNKISA